jgi:hypothetical protein
MLVLQELGWLIDGICGKRLTVIMDNCAGQNKNKHVLRLALWLVELGYFETVEFVFYVRGHTKNCCDRLFNLFKTRYRNADIFTMSQLRAVLNEMDNISFKDVGPEVFFDYCQMLDVFYKNFVSGTVQKNHMFWVQHTLPTTMHTKTFTRTRIWPCCTTIKLIRLSK